MTVQVRIEVCGGIASGKSTLAALLGENDVHTLHERFHENPFFSQFYAEPTAYAFETEITYLLQHFSQVREANSTPRIAADFSLVLDLAYAYVSLERGDRPVFETVLDRVVQKIGLPSLVVRLQCESSVELRRIRARNREAEQVLSLEYLNELDSAIERALQSVWFHDVPVLRINSNRDDFRPNGADRYSVLERTLAVLGNHDV